MELKVLRCPQCGAEGKLSKIEENGIILWHCAHCAGKFAEENAELLALSTEKDKDFAIPENADLIIINTPLQDITVEEKDALITMRSRPTTFL